MDIICPTTKKYAGSIVLKYLTYDIKYPIIGFAMILRSVRLSETVYFHLLKGEEYEILQYLLDDYFLIDYLRFTNSSMIVDQKGCRNLERTDSKGIVLSCSN